MWKLITTCFLLATSCTISGAIGYQVGQIHQLKWQYIKNKNLITKISNLNIKLAYRENLLWQHGVSPKEYENH